MARTILRVGDPAPWFIGRTTTSDEYHFHTVAGRYIVVSFFGSAQQATAREFLGTVTGELRRRFDDTFLTFYGVSIDPLDAGSLRESIPGIRYFLDFDRRISALYGAADDAGDTDRVTYRSLTLVLDPRMRVCSVVPWIDPATHVAQLRDVLDGLPPLPRDEPAPVLVLPRVFEPELCRELIGLYETNGGSESSFMRQMGEKTVPVLDYGFKRRTDFFFEDQPEFVSIRKRIDSRLKGRLVPEVEKAFQFQITRIERYLVACYDAGVGGFFRPHRDNTTRGTMHRKFACTINLNADDYDGGDLRFPEFGQRSYRAPTGGAVVFSCSLLHEAQPVTRGTRYAFLPFFYDDEAAEVRRQNRQYISEEIVDRRVPSDAQR